MVKLIIPDFLTSPLNVTCIPISKYPVPKDDSISSLFSEFSEKPSFVLTNIFPSVLINKSKYSEKSPDKSQPPNWSGRKPSTLLEGTTPSKIIPPSTLLNLS